MKKNRLLITAFGIAAVAFLLFLPFHSFAADLVTDELSTVGETSGLATIELGILVARIIRIVLGVLGVVMVCLIIYAGWLYFTSQGEEKNTKKAKDIIKTTIIGLLIILSAYSIATFVLNYLLEAAGLSGGISTTTAQNFNEPLAGSLGSGIIESHYPARDATDIPRNTRIYVTFKEAIKVDTIIIDDDDATTPNDLNTANVTIAPTDSVDGLALTSDQVHVAVTADHKTFSFDPTVLLGSDTAEMNYTVTLGTGIQKVLPDGSFAGAFDTEGYAWRFEVSTEVDLTPPQVVSVVPANLSPNLSTVAPNIIVAITFNEAMDPIAASGTYTGVTPLPAEAPPEFTNIKVLKPNTDTTAGTYSVSNVYRTVEFVPTDICGSDPCGNDIFCLPRNAVGLHVVAKAAPLGTDPPQAAMTDEGQFNGLVDAAGNSLDGNGDGGADGPGSPPSLDNYEWSFTTLAEPRTDVPTITSVGPTVNQGQVGLNQNVTINFNSLMQSSTLNSTNVRLLPDFVQAFWYQDSNAENPGSVPDVVTVPSSFDDNFTVVTINHATFWESDNPGENTNHNSTTGDLYSYYPVITHGVKSAWQICMSPAVGPNNNGVITSCSGGTGLYCCNGVDQATPCTFTGVTISP